MHTGLTLAVLTLAVLALTLGLIFARPRGLHEAWATGIGAALMLTLGLETVGQARQAVAQGAGVLGFLLALMLLSALLDRSGFFEWAAILAARAARGSGGALYRNVFLLGAVITALLSLDTTAIILTPVVLAFVRRLRLPAAPFLLACAFVANAGSLLLPVSNLTNLLFQSAFGLSFGAFVLRMALPQVGAVAINYWVFRWLFRHELPERFDPTELPAPTSVLPDAPYFYGAVAALGAVLVGYFVGPVFGAAPWMVAGAGGAALLVWGLARRRVGGDIAREISWPLFPFVAGLLIVIRGVENLGLAAWAARGLGTVGHEALAVILVSGFGAAAASNAVNNVPAALLAISALHQAHAGPPGVYGALLGCDIGPNLTLSGSLATMLVITASRKQGEDVGAGQFLRAGLWATPATLLTASVLLWLGLCVFG